MATVTTNHPVVSPERSISGHTANRIALAVRVLLALPFILFGLNKFIGFADMPPPAGQQAQLFLGAMFGSYLVTLVGATEIIGGLLLLFRRTAFMGFLLLSPVVVNIAAFHLAHDMPGNGIWLFTSALYVYLLAQYRHRLLEFIG